MMRSHWKAVAIAAILMMTVLSLTAVAAEKKSTAAKADKATGQMVPGCAMMGSMQGDMKGCCMQGGMKGDTKGCCMQGGMKGDMKGCCMHGGMGMSAGMPGCGMKGGMGMGAGMPGCGMKGGMGMGAGMPGCGMKGGMGAGPGPMCGPGPMMLHGLDLTADQQKKAGAIHERAQRQMIQQQADLHIAMMDLQQAMRDETPEKSKIDAQIDRVAQLRAQMQKSRMATQLEVRGLLTPEQLKKWQACPMGGMGEEDD
jgi:Spy/CpxP family protein refolding chaperone